MHDDLWVSRSPLASLPAMSPLLPLRLLIYSPFMVIPRVAVLVFEAEGGIVLSLLRLRLLDSPY